MDINFIFSFSNYKLQETIEPTNTLDKYITKLSKSDSYLNSFQNLKIICYIHKNKIINPKRQFLSFASNGDTITVKSELNLISKNYYQVLDDICDDLKLKNKNIRQSNFKMMKIDDILYKGEKFCRYKPYFGIVCSLKGEIYTGNFMYGLPNGFGKLLLESKAEYVGEFEDGLKFGYGIYKSENGEKYEGEFRNNLKEGVGILKLSFLTFYGEFKNDTCEGLCRIVYDNNSVYEGEIHNCILEGYGVLKKNNGDEYEGEFRNSKMEGIGRYRFNYGDEYLGRFRDNKFNGKGMINYNDGSVFIGYFKDNYKWGHGELKDNNGNVIESGYYKNNVLIYLDYLKLDYKLR